ncbi:MAG: hypothetical protein Q8M94_02595 [Ignavibacteria bacterium]|nr:hypothetical protein [Ignavibacteria bacterium]
MIKDKTYMKNKTPLILFFALTALYILFGYGVTISNDSVTNVDQIVSLDLWSRSSHFSFHLFGIIFYLFFSKLLGLSAVASIEIMLSVFSAAAAVALYQVTLKKFNDVNQAIITVIIYSIASGIFRFSCQVEYLILVPSFGIISLYFYSKGQYLIAGILFGLGLLTSVLLVLFIPMFLLFTSVREIFKKQNIIFAISMIALFLTVNIFTYRETVSGNWSYGGELSAYKEIFGEINFLRPAAILVYGYLRSFNILILLLPFTLYYLFNHNRELFYISLFTLFIHLPFAIPEARYGGYQMTAYPIIAVASAYFLTRILRSPKWIITISLIFSFLNFYIVYSEREFNRDLKDTYVKLSNELEDNSVLIIYQAVKPVRNIYAPNLRVLDLHSDYQSKLAEKRYSDYVAPDLNEIFTNNDTVYLLESGVSMPDDNFKLLVSRFTKNQGAKVKGFALDKILSVNPSVRIEKLNGYLLDVYKLSKSEKE